MLRAVTRFYSERFPWNRYGMHETITDASQNHRETDSVAPRFRTSRWKKCYVFVEEVLAFEFLNLQLSTTEIIEACGYMYQHV